MLDETFEIYFPKHCTVCGEKLTENDEVFKNASELVQKEYLTDEEYFTAFAKLLELRANSIHDGCKGGEPNYCVHDGNELKVYGIRGLFIR
jgi:hypothetical protein